MVTVTVVERTVDVSQTLNQVDVTVNERPVNVDVGLNVQAVSGPSFLQSYTSTVALAVGTVVALDSAGDLELAADCGNFEAVGVSFAIYPIGPALIEAFEGREFPVLFSVAPTAAQNGDAVYLSTTPGEATMTAPTSGDIVRLGVLSGGDGATLIPTVIWSKEVEGPANHLPWVEDKFIATQGQIAFIISAVPTDAISFTLLVNGVFYDNPADYTVAGTTVAWLQTEFVLSAGDELHARYY